MTVPTAVHDRADVHDTAESWPPAAPLGFGLGWTDHVLPSQRSARVSCTPEFEVSTLPTAVHASAEVHDTPDRTLPNCADGLGVR
jgi:hypothetical protein